MTKSFTRVHTRCATNIETVVYTYLDIDNDPEHPVGYIELDFTF